MNDLKLPDLKISQLIKTAELSLMVLKLRQEGTEHYVKKELAELGNKSNIEMGTVLLQSASAICLRIDEIGSEK